MFRKNKCGTTTTTAVVQYLKEIIPKIRRTKTTERTFSELVILVVEENGALSGGDGYCTSINGKYFY